MKKALLVGINSYGFPNELPSSVRDVETFRDVLETIYRFDHVRMLKDGEATREGVDRGLDWLVQSVSANDRLVFFFSGHGTRIERNGVIEEALVTQDGRLLDDHHLADRLEHVPAGVITLVLDCCFAGLEEMLVHPSGQVELLRTKRWIPIDVDRGRQERLTGGPKAFTPFGHMKPAAFTAVAAYVRGMPLLESPPARLTTLAEPQAKALVVLPCLADEATAAATTKSDGLSTFTFSLVNAVRRLGPNRSVIEVIQATGHELRQLGLRQTPLVREPAQPEHLALRAFLTFQPALFVSPSSTPGMEGEEDLGRSIAEAVRSTLITMKEGKSMQGTMPGTQMYAGEDIGAIVNTLTPIVAAALQARHQPYWGGGFSPMGFGGQGAQGGVGGPSWWLGNVGQRGFEDIGQIIAAVVPAVLTSLQGRSHQPYLPGLQPFQGFQGQQGFQWPHGFQAPQGLQGSYGQMGGGVQPNEVGQIASVVTPIVLALLQSRSYQGHFGQYQPRAA